MGNDIKFGLRMLLKNPGFTAVAVVTLALGIGANTAIFSVVNAVLLRPLPYKDPGRLAVFHGIDHRTGSSGPVPVCDPDYVEWRDHNQVFEQIAAFHGQPLNLTGADEPERIQAAVVTASLFPLLGVRPSLGRTFLDEEQLPGRNFVVVLSEELWRRRFASDPALVGKTVTLDGNSFTVVGIMPAGFDFPAQPAPPALWLPATLAGDCHNAFLQAAARLKPGVTLQRARADVVTASRRLDEGNHRQNPGWEMTLVPLQEAMVSNIRPLLLILLGAVSFVLLIACANVANLMLARAAGRRREIAIRAALGAGRMRVVRQLLTESVMLSALGGGLGLLLALWGLEVLLTLIPKSLPRAQSINVDGWVLGFTLLISVVTGILFGLAPALHASRLDLNESLKEGGRATTESLGSRGVRSALVTVEMALAVVLLISAALLMKSFVLLTRVNAGFDVRNVLTMNFILPESRYRTEAQMRAFYDQLLERITALPGVQIAGVISFGLPLGGQALTGDFTVEGQPAPTAEVWASKTLVSSEYFRAMGIPLLKGRYFTARDANQTPRVAIISQSMARRFFPSQDPIGHRIVPGFAGSPPYTIVGVVGDVKQWGLGAETPVIIYMPYAQSPLPFLLSTAAIVVRTGGDPIGLAAPVQQAVRAVDRDMPVFDIASMGQLVYKSIAEPRFNSSLFGVFAVLALLLAVLGIYGVMSYAVTQRTYEIGVRMALGARRENVLGLLLRQGLGLALAGVVIGVGGALALTHLLANLLYGIRPTDPATFFLVSSVLLGVALLACYIPARRATKVDPMVALRYE